MKATHSDNVSVLLDNGDRAFQTEQLFGAGDGSDINIANLNGNGILQYGRHAQFGFHFWDP